jgi:hypothetical protein
MRAPMAPWNERVGAAIVLSPLSWSPDDALIAVTPD